MCLTIACANGNKTTIETDSPEAQAMLDKLKAIPLQRQFMFGHHDDPVYGIGCEECVWRLSCYDVFRFGTY